MTAKINAPCRVDGCGNKYLASGYCSKHYQMWRKWGDPTHASDSRGLDPKESLEFYGWTVTETDCWEFNGPRNVQNYGRVTIDSKTYRAARLAYEIWNGPIPNGLIVRHKCDNPPCINPNHLELGTYRDNAMDMVSRGRNVDVRGEKHGGAKLTDAQVMQIKRRYANGELQKTLAVEFNVDFRNISSIVTGASWKHVILEEGL